MAFTNLYHWRLPTVSVTLLILIFHIESSSVCAYSRFELPECDSKDCDRIVSITQDKSSLNIYVTTQRSLKILAEDLTLIKEVNTSMTAGDNNVLTILRGSEILNCKNDNSGTCELRDSSSLKEISKEITGSDVTYPGGGPIVGWIDNDIGDETVLTTALSTKERVHFAQPLPLVSTRTFRTLELLVDHQFVPSSYLQPSPCLADDIEPFYGFTAGNYRYILKTHRPTEERGVTQVKLIRLCKNDQTYRSYMELPLECQGHNEGLSGQTEFVSSVAYYTNGVLYVSFTKKKYHTIKTYICQYNIDFINNRFNNRRRECLEGVTKTTEIPWHRLNYCPKAPPPQLDFSRFDDPSYCYNESIAQPLGGSKSIVATAMSPLTTDGFRSDILIVSPTYRGET
ncbi:plexin-A2-like [Apostichopus japonicus]|uniref:plexin-A2-like n=1 Tax=Stichopus japonicus TaxID=307972 RepID=UPI003AB4131D